MEIIDDEIAEACIDYLGRQNEAGNPFFVWLNFTHMHLRTHTKPESMGQAGHWQSPYHDTMVDHDKNVGQILDALDELGLAEDTIVIYSTDNGPHANSWPDGATTPFRSEKDTNWEGAFRVPELSAGRATSRPGSVSNEIVQHHDWLPTFLAAAGEPDIVEKCKAGHQAGDKTFKVHIDGYNLLPYLTGEIEHSPRKGFIYFSDDADVLGIRFDNWKVVFMEQRVQGTMQIWAEPFVTLRIPKIFNLRTDPFERADQTSNTYWDWFIDHDYIAGYAIVIVTQFLDTFREFPPRHEPATLHHRPRAGQAPRVPRRSITPHHRSIHATSADTRLTAPRGALSTGPRRRRQPAPRPRSPAPKVPAAAPNRQRTSPPRRGAPAEPHPTQPETGGPPENTEHSERQAGRTRTGDATAIENQPTGFLSDSRSHPGCPHTQQQAARTLPHRCPRGAT